MTPDILQPCQPFPLYTCAARNYSSSDLCLHKKFVVEPLPLAVAIGYNHSGWAKFKIVNMCLRCPVAIVTHVLWSHMSCVTHVLCPICLVVSHVLWSHMSCVSHVLWSHMSRDSCPLIPYVSLCPMSFGPICLVVSHVLWSHMSRCVPCPLVPYVS